jgi:hypothetical protein
MTGLAWARTDVIASGLQFLTETSLAGSELFRSPVIAAWNSSTRPVTLSHICAPAEAPIVPMAGALAALAVDTMRSTTATALPLSVRMPNSSGKSISPRHHHRSRHHSNLVIDERFLDVTAIDDEPGGSYRGEILRFPNPLLK